MSSDPAADDELERAEERRREPRHLTCYPFNFQRGDSGETGAVEIAIIRDLSPTGAFLLAACEPDEGSRLKLHLDLDEDPVSTTVVEGRVVRTEPLPPAERTGLWSCGVAVQFVEPVPELGPKIEALARRIAAGTSSSR